jgi:hypothetical protein
VEGVAAVEAVEGALVEAIAVVSEARVSAVVEEPIRLWTTCWRRRILSKREWGPGPLYGCPTDRLLFMF